MQFVSWIFAKLHLKPTRQRGNYGRPQGNVCFNPSVHSHGRKALGGDGLRVFERQEIKCQLSEFTEKTVRNMVVKNIEQYGPKSH